MKMSIVERMERKRLIDFVLQYSGIAIASDEFQADALTRLRDEKARFGPSQCYELAIRSKEEFCFKIASKLSNFPDHCVVVAGDARWPVVCMLKAEHSEVFVRGIMDWKNPPVFGLAAPTRDGAIIINVSHDTDEHHTIMLCGWGSMAPIMPEIEREWPDGERFTAN